jgi:acetyl-CoA carboxylase/biotin carboxylase 1
LDWRTSREFFYWRLKRRLSENDVIKTILNVEPSINYQLASNYLQQWFNEDNHNNVRRIFFFFLLILIEIQNSI